MKRCQKALALRSHRLFSLADGRQVKNNVRARRGDKGVHAAQLGGTAVISAALHPLMIWRQDHTGGGAEGWGGAQRTPFISPQTFFIVSEILAVEAA